MNKKFLTDIKNIRTAIDTNKLVVFAGSGISIDAGIPSWNELINEISSEINIPNNEKDYLRIAQMYFNERQQKEFIEKIRSILKHKKIKHNEIHEEIFKLNPEHILTTNFDDLLDQVIKKESLPFSIVSKDAEFPYALNTNLLVKVHGDLDNTDIVIKEDDYIDYSLNHPLIEAFIKSVFASKVVLFIGYSFSDIDLKMIVQTVRNILGKDFQNAYLLSTEKNYHPTQREYLKNRGIVVINYFDAFENETNYIENYLRKNNALRENYFKPGVNLTKEGQHLLNFIKFVSSYDKFNEPLTEKNFIDQIYLSLNRFSEFKSLPPEFIANLYPFNVSKSYVHNYERYSLKTKNLKLYKLFFEQVELVNDEVIFKPETSMNVTEEETWAFANKLKEVISFLNYSLIFYLVKEIGPDSIGNYGWSHERKELRIKKLTKCDCFNCTYERLELNEVVKKVLNLTIDETTNVRSDLALAYIHYKLGNFNQSLNLFKEVANKAWQRGKYFIYYIAKHNIKTLGNLIKLFETNLTEEERAKILKELEDIDFDKLLSQIPFLGESEYKLLKYIRDDDVLNRAEKEIDGTYEKIFKTYNQYKTTRSWVFSGPHYYPEIVLELNKIIAFYTNNYILIDEYSNFTRICKKGIEALLISFATHQDYKQKLEKLNEFFFDVTILYGKAEEIKTFIDKYNINDLIFNEEDLYPIINTINNFLKSFFTINKFWGKADPNVSTQNQANNYFFGEKCRRIFSNIFLLLSKVELKEEGSKDLIKNLLSFVENENFLYWMNIQYLSDFIFKNHILFSKENLENLLKSVLHKLKTYNHDNKFIKVIADVFKENNLSKITDQDLIVNIYNLDKKSGENRYTIIDLWRVSDDIIKQELSNKIDEALNTKFDNELYVKAVFNDIIDFNKYFEQFINNADKTKGSNQYTLNVGKPAEYSHTFMNAIFFIYQMKIANDDERLKPFTNLSDYMQFYLSPETFDYSKFNVEWLYMAYDWNVFHERFSKIPAIKEAIEKQLREKFEEELAKIFTKYYA